MAEDLQLENRLAKLVTVNPVRAILTEDGKQRLELTRA